ncbi:MAG TPA: RICIN domain-containing protein [Candidatus Limnocylindrales bacterium]|nr:RICIN domain-containing protein [Candidatus Limnocylindrales bacterium]
MKIAFRTIGSLALTAIAMLGIAATAPAQAATVNDTVSGKVASGPTITTAGYFRIVNQASGKCLTPWGSGDGVAITQVTCDGSANQWWYLDTGSVGEIVNYGTGKCLDLWGNLAGDAQLVFTWTCYGAASQRWRPVSVGGGYFELHPHYTDQCLDLAGGISRDGAVIQQWGCHAFNSNQRWWLG